MSENFDFCSYSWIEFNGRTWTELDGQLDQNSKIQLGRWRESPSLSFTVMSLFKFHVVWEKHSRKKSKVSLTKSIWMLIFHLGGKKIPPKIFTRKTVYYFNLWFNEIWTFSQPWDFFSKDLIFLFQWARSHLIQRFNRTTRMEIKMIRDIPSNISSIFLRTRLRIVFQHFTSNISCEIVASIFNSQGPKTCQCWSRRWCQAFGSIPCVSWDKITLASHNNLCWILYILSWKLTYVHIIIFVFNLNIKRKLQKEILVLVCPSYSWSCVWYHLERSTGLTTLNWTEWRITNKKKKWFGSNPCAQKIQIRIQNEEKNMNFY